MAISGRAGADLTREQRIEKQEAGMNVLYLFAKADLHGLWLGAKTYRYRYT